MKSHRSVCEIIVRNDVCIGCGICAGICPADVLAMQFNQYGEYVPVEQNEECTACTLCLFVCPFWNQTENQADEDTLAQAVFGQEPGIQHRLETGYYLDCFVGYSNVGHHRANGASGGLATWLLQTLLEQNIVDRVVCVTPNDDPAKLFRFAVFDCVEDVRRSSKSAYYPVELSGIVRDILQEEARYAIIGLPCFLKGLRLAMRKSQRLRQRIVVLAGLVCGQIKSKFFAEYLCAMVGGDPAQMTRAIFRVKDPTRPASDFGFRFECLEANGAKSGTVFWTEGMSEPWVNDYFKPNACNYCDDVFAEVADVTFMDAWLPEYSHDYRGTSIALVRSHLVLNLFLKGIDSEALSVEGIGVDRVIRSQSGVLMAKREHLQHRLYQAKSRKCDTLYIPHKRVAPKRSKKPHHRLFLALRERMRISSRGVFARQRNRRGVSAVRRATRQARFLYQSVQTVIRLLGKAKRLCKHYFR